MPKNLRPSKLFDPIRQDQSLSEIENAQNQWDLLEAQEKANEIAQQRLDEERKKNNDFLYAEEKRLQHEEDLEITKQNNNIEMRYNKLCDDFGLNYEDLCDLETLFHSDYEEAKQIYQDFYNFRKLHYAKDVEILFRKIKLDFGNVEKNKIESTGSNEDYVDYIYGIILDNTSLIEEIKECGVDILLWDIIKYVVEEQELSEANIQYVFNIPLRRTKRIIKQMEERGIIDKRNRTVLMTKEILDKILE